MLLQIMYLSRARASLTPSDVSHIIADAQRRNLQRGVTGALYFGRGFFLQAIEGDASTVMRLYGKILDDPRHEDLHLLTVRPVAQRYFARWGMGRVRNVEATPGTKTVLDIAQACGDVWNDATFDEILAIFRASLADR